MDDGGRSRVNTRLCAGRRGRTAASATRHCSSMRGARQHLGRSKAALRDHAGAAQQHARTLPRGRGTAMSAHLQRDLLVVAVHGVVLVDVERPAALAVHALLRLDLEVGLARLHQRPDLVAAGAAVKVEDGHLGIDAGAARHDACHLDQRVEMRVPAATAPRPFSGRPHASTDLGTLTHKHAYA